MWGAHCGVLWPQPSSSSQGGQAHRAPRQTLGSLAGDRISKWQCGILLPAEVGCRCETTMEPSSTQRCSISYMATRLNGTRKKTAS
jgi:hypothetical protein